MLRARLRYAAASAFVLTVIALSGCESPFVRLGDARQGGVPADWAGIWDVHVVSRLCESDSIVFETTRRDTVCEGADVSDEFDIPGLLSHGPVDFGLLCATVAPRLEGNTLTYSCDAQVTIAVCQNTISTRVNLTLDPETHTYTGTGRVAADIEPNGEPCGPDVCFDLEFSGTRIQATSPTCAEKAAAR